MRSAVRWRGNACAISLRNAPNNSRTFATRRWIGVIAVPTSFPFRLLILDTARATPLAGNLLPSVLVCTVGEILFCVPYLPPYTGVRDDLFVSALALNVELANGVRRNPARHPATNLGGFVRWVAFVHLLTFRVKRRNLLAFTVYSLRS